MTNRENGCGKTTYVVEGHRHGVSPVFAMVVVLLSVLLGCGIPLHAMADDSSAGTSSGATDTSGQGSATFTDDITDTENLLGSDLSTVTDKIKETKQEIGVTVRLMYLPSFGTDGKPAKWAGAVLEGLDPDPNTVMLAVASDDGNLVVAVSSNSDEWLKRQSTVDDLSQAATDPLLKDTPDWSGAAIAMMNELVKVQRTSTSSSNVMIGVVILVVVLALLVVIIVVAMLIHRRNRKRALQGRGRRRHKARAYHGEPSRSHSAGGITESGKDEEMPGATHRDGDAIVP